jgi:hypothetical protein
MKKLLVLILLGISFLPVSAQLKGTNTLGVGFNRSTYQLGPDGTSQDRKATSASLGYGHFIKDNVRLGISGNYGYARFNYGTSGMTVVNRETGGVLTLQKYFPLVKKFYAFAAGAGSYARQKTENNGITESRGNRYFLGASGGATYFLSKRFALEADVLSAGLNYSKIKRTDNSDEYTSTDLSVSTTGTLTNLGFRVYLLF